MIVCLVLGWDSFAAFFLCFLLSVGRTRERRSENSCVRFIFVGEQKPSIAKGLFRKRVWICDIPKKGLLNFSEKLTKAIIRNAVGVSGSFGIVAVVPNYLHRFQKSIPHLQQIKYIGKLLLVVNKLRSNQMTASICNVNWHLTRWLLAPKQI